MLNCTLAEAGMSNGRMKDRLSKLRLVPTMAARDHRFYLNEEGRDRRLQALSRAERRKLAKAGRSISTKYHRHMQAIAKSGAGYPVDQVLRQMAIEYTHRYAASGLYNQPMSFNYFEPFCEIDLIDGSIAPYAKPSKEVDHLFSVTDFFDYMTSSHSDDFDLSKLFDLPQGTAFHFTCSGNVKDLTFLTAEGREFVVSGFSMIRHDTFVNWYVLGGAIFNEDEWAALEESDEALEVSHVPPWKQLFLSEVRAKNGNGSGPPTPLEGTKTAQRTIVAGEIDLNTGKHVARAYMTETERMFAVVADDPDVFDHVDSAEERAQKLADLQQRVEEAAVLWGVGEAMLQLPSYFAFMVNLERKVADAAGVSNRGPKKGGRGLGVQFKNIESIQVVDDLETAVRSFTPPHYKMDTTGFWRRLNDNSEGKGPSGERVTGRTWVKRNAAWRSDAGHQRTIYIKSTIAAAKIEIDEHLRRAADVEFRSTAHSEPRGVVYILRCTLMADEVYKVGWTSGTAKERAAELSGATGVPTAFIVVEAWKHVDPRGLEKNIHALLDQYRLNDRREFFKLPYSALRRIINSEIERVSR